MMTQEEKAANSALSDALKALERADEFCALAGYGSEILSSLLDAKNAVKYASDVATGRI